VGNARDSRAIGGDLDVYSNPEHHGFSITGAKVGSQSLGQHSFWRVLYGSNALHDDVARDLGVLHFPGLHRIRTYRTYHMVRVDLAQASNWE